MTPGPAVAVLLCCLALLLALFELRARREQSTGGGSVSLMSADGGDARRFAAALAGMTEGSEAGVHLVLAWVARRGVPLRDRPDVAQLSLERAFRAFPGFDGGDGSPGAFRAWLRTIASRTAARHLGRVWRSGEDLTPDDPRDEGEPDPAPLADASLEGEEQRRAVFDLLAMLPAHSPERRILASFYLDGEPMQDIAARLGVSLAEAYRLRARGLDALRTLAAEQTPERP